MHPVRVRHAKVLVLGAGLQGSCIALALAARGHGVVVLDRAAAPMMGASRTTEGKIHLGYVYALDRSGETQRRMLAGALAFAPLLDHWLGPQPWEQLRSPPFWYAVMPDSLLSADDLEAEYARASGEVADVVGSVQDKIGANANYLGRPLDGTVRRHRGDAAAPRIYGELAREVFSTEEVAVDPIGLSDAVRTSLRDEPHVDVQTATEVVGAARTTNGFTVDVVNQNGRRDAWHALTVVNCLWDDRLRVDRTVGVCSPVDSWTFRVKHVVVVAPRVGTSPAPTVTMVQGPYGDVIAWNPSRVSLCWYPVGRTAMRTVVATSDCSGLLASPPPDGVVERTLEVMGGMFPSLAAATVLDVFSGVIVAPGASDIDDPASGLHMRATPAVHEHDGWWTIDTGKLTLAPMLAHEASTRIDTALRGA